jgi:hypothetical protein
MTLAKLAVFYRDSLNLKFLNSNYELSYFQGSLQPKFLINLQKSSLYKVDLILEYRSLFNLLTI